MLEEANGFRKPMVTILIYCFFMYTAPPFAPICTIYNADTNTSSNSVSYDAVEDFLVIQPIAIFLEK